MTRLRPSAPHPRAPAARALLRALGAAFLFVAPAIAQIPGDGAEPAASQSPSDGLWWAITVGGGSARLTCNICQPSRDLGPTLGASVGAYASHRLRVGVEGGGWTHEEENDDREKAYRLGIVAQLAPNLGSGLYLLGGFGWSGYRAGDFHFDAPRVTLGAGWELPLAPGWAIGNELALDAAAYGSLRNDETPIDRPVGLSTLRLSIQVRRR